MKRLRDELEKKRFYRIYRSTRPITSLEGLSPVGLAKPLSGWNTDYDGITAPPELKALRYVVDDAQGPIPPGTAIYAYNPRQAESAYYAVTAVIEGRENSLVSQENSLRAPVEEIVGPGVPVLQRVERPAEFNYVEKPTLHYYVRWESLATSSVPGKPFDYLVGIPPQPAKPARVGIHMHAWGGSLNRDYGWWFNAEKGAMLVTANEDPYDWWTGYHELIGTGQPLAAARDWQAGVVRPYTQRRLLSFLDWVATKYDVDLERTFSAGSSMGGSGSLMLAIRFPERIAWAVSWVGVHRPAETPGFKESYETVYGKPEWGVRFEDGTPVWQHYDDVWYLRQHPEKEIGLLVFSNGKNDGGIGWP
ncbi:MAG TPA: alpha/beta hydrolase-fold protein, partial [Vicinamibacterales bacterium]